MLDNFYVPIMWCKEAAFNTQRSVLQVLKLLNVVARRSWKNDARVMENLTLQHYLGVDKINISIYRYNILMTSLLLCNFSDKDDKMTTSATAAASGSTTQSSIQGSPSRSFSWAGQTVTSLTLGPGQTTTVPLRACICSAGVYDLSSLFVAASPTKAYGETLSLQVQRPVTQSLLTVRDKEGVTSWGVFMLFV